MKRIALTCLLTLALAAPAAAAKSYSCPIPGDAMTVYRLAWVDAGRYLRSGAVVVDSDHLAENNSHDREAVTQAYQLLKRKYGVGAVVNLRADSAEDSAAAKAAGMAYLHLAIADGSPPSAAQTAQFFQFLHQNQHAVVLWHCAGGIGRTGVFAAMLRLREGWSTKEAAEEMFAMGLNYNQAAEHLPALNAFAAAMGKPGYYPADWPFPRVSPVDYRAVVKQLPPLK